jgi:hypothetical protein
VLLGNIGGDAAAVAERDPLLLGPGPDGRAVCPARGRSPRPLAFASPPGVFDVRG